MNIVELNDVNRRHMVSETRTDLKFEWEDKEIMDIIMKKFKNIYPYSNDPKEFINDTVYINNINRFINKFNRGEISEELFLINMEKTFKKMFEKFDTLRYQSKYDLNYYKKNLDIANRLLIDGDGGIGKSYFLFKLEERLRNSSIKHLCIYCKYTKNIPDEIIEEIKSINNEFYFIIDAFNELNMNEQNEMIKKVESLIQMKNVNIIISYRTNNLEKIVKTKLEELLKNKYTFYGVEYEASLTKIVESYGIEATKYIDILETNNPFYLKMLYKILDDPKIRKDKIGNLVQITFILEAYIKKVCGLDCWNKTKEIGVFMFENNDDSIEENEIKKLLGNGATDYINEMINNNLMDFYLYENKKRFVFNIQRLSDYIIARTLHKKITDLNSKQIIKIIDKKLEKMYSLAEPFILLIIDKYRENIQEGINIILNSNLKEYFNLSILRRAHFTKEQIEIIQNNIVVEDFKTAFLEVGGCENRPFNCTNYLNKKLSEEGRYLDGILTKFYESTYIMKLKNMLYSIIFIEKNNEYIEEAFWYSFWLTSVSNPRIRNLAIKVLFDITDKFMSYVNILTEYYYKIDEFYIRKAIIRVITSMDIKDKKVISFLKKVLNDYEQIDSEIIFRISTFLHKDLEYIGLKKYNVYRKLKNNVIVDKEIDLNQIVWMVDLYDKYLLKFESYNRENELSLYDDFVLNNKKKIMKWNKKLNRKFKCVSNDGECKYSIGSQRFIKHMSPLKLIDMNHSKMFIAFQEIFKYVCGIYNYKYCKDTEKFDEHINKFEESLLKKILLISQDLLLGSLMCNYYTKEFSVFNDDITFGYKVYKPINVSEEELRIFSPVSLYCEEIDKLNNEINNRLDLYGMRDENWYKDKEISIENIKKLSNPIEKCGREWSLISADIHKYVRDENGNSLYTETYDYNISIDSEIVLTGNCDSRDLTIVNDEYIGNIKKYKDTEYKKSTCVRMVESYSKDFKETYLKLPPTRMILEFDLIYNKKYSTWNLKDGETIIYCDNNSKDYYNIPITGAIYIRTDYLNKIIEKYKVKYWAYTEKSYLDNGFNEEASLHIELDEKSNINSIFNNSKLTSVKREVNNKCKKCKYETQKEKEKNIIDYEKFIEELGYVKQENDE